MSEWQPIETRPEDTEILIARRWGSTDLIMIANDSWSSDRECWVDWGGGTPPTHWMPLDALPRVPVADQPAKDGR